jgi:hypothetical protein
MPVRSRTPFAAPFLAFLLLAGCNDAAQGVDSAQSAAAVRPAVQQAYKAESVGVTINRRAGGAQRLEVDLVNPGGREATTQQSARTVARTAHQAYEGTIDSVRVNFEYSSMSGPVEVGFHRRYSFASSELSGSAAASDTSAGNADTSATRP